MSSPAPTRGWPGALRALAHRPFQIMYAGEAVSLIGTWMQQIALSWLAYRLTGSSLLLGTVAFASQMPILLLAPFGGILADRLSRRRILIAAQSAWVVQALALAALSASGHAEVWQIIALSIVSGVLFAFDMPARQAFVSDLVGREDLPNAVALNNALVNGATVAGPVFASLLVARISEAACFFGNGVSKIFVVISLLLIKERPAALAPPKGSPLRDLAEGFKWARGNRPAQAILGLLGVVGFLGMPVTVLMPMVASQVLNAGAEGLGVLMACYGTGALLGSVVLALRKSERGLGRWMLAAAVCLGLGLVLFALSDRLWLSAALLLPVGGSLIMVINVSITLMQTLAPENLRGRAMALHLMVFMSLNSLGAFALGWAAQIWAIHWTLAACGIGCVASGAVFGLISQRNGQIAEDTISSN